MAVRRDEKWISNISNEISEAIELASVDELDWAVPAGIFSSAFPGGFAALVNHDLLHDCVNFAEWVDLDDAVASSYREHFAFINPWAEVWTRMRSGSVFVAERQLPSRTFADTEFYNDWLRHAGNATAGVGLRVDASPTDIVHFPLQYPARFATDYDGPAAEVSRRLAGALTRAISASRQQRELRELMASQVAIVNRRWPTLVVDAVMRIRDMNVEADADLSQGDFLRSVGGRLIFADRDLDVLVAQGVRDLAFAPNCDVKPDICRASFDPVVVSLHRIPRMTLNVNLLIPEQPLILVTIKRLTRPPDQPALEGFRTLFELTPAEVKLCQSLLAGRNLQEAAVELGISYETARSRSKSIFQKAGVNSQAALCMLLSRYQS
jgi:DNA-binding CsgD family transcriptional regulator